jgi:hypothetical protein
VLRRSDQVGALWLDDVTNVIAVANLSEHADEAMNGNDRAASNAAVKPTRPSLEGQHAPV